MYTKKLAGDNCYISKEEAEMDKSKGSSHLGHKSKVSSLRVKETSNQQRELK